MQDLSYTIFVKGSYSETAKRVRKTANPVVIQSDRGVHWSYTIFVKGSYKW